MPLLNEEDEPVWYSLSFLTLMEAQSIQQSSLQNFDKNFWLKIFLGEKDFFYQKTLGIKKL